MFNITLWSWNLPNLIHGSLRIQTDVGLSQIMSDPPMSWTLHTYQVLLLVQNVKLLADTYWQIFVNIHFQCIYRSIYLTIWCVCFGIISWKWSDLIVFTECVFKAIINVFHYILCGNISQLGSPGPSSPATGDMMDQAQSYGLLSHGIEHFQLSNILKPNVCCSIKFLVKAFKLSIISRKLLARKRFFAR